MPKRDCGGGGVIRILVYLKALGKKHGNLSWPQGGAKHQADTLRFLL